MFNEANVDNRSRHPVRGRVIVFTTSLIVEFLEPTLRYSFPLFFTQGYPSGYGLTFVVEVDGFLTFDQGAEVKICDVGPYERFDVMQLNFSVVFPADPFVARLLTGQQYSVSPGGREPGSGFVNRFNVMVSAPGGSTYVSAYPPVPVDDTPSDFYTVTIPALFPPGAVFKAPAGYSLSPPASA